MRPRIIPNLSIVALRRLRTPISFRPFTNIRSSPIRPQLPFQLASHRARRPVRLFTTSKFVKDTTTHIAKVSGCILGIFVLCHFFFYGVQNEYFERIYRTPPEWTYLTRAYLRSSQWFIDNDDPPEWYHLGQKLLVVLARLEDPKRDGADINPLHAVGTGLDVTSKTEAWRQGYYEALMVTAKVAEYLDAWVLDATRNLPFPANTVIGPSNPNRRPVPIDSPTPAREEDCVAAFDPPDKYYTKILATKGFTPKQRLDATLAYASWLDYKGNPSAAAEAYQWALDIALSTSHYAADPSKILDPKTHILKPGVGTDSLPVDSNVLRAVTLIAVHHARNGDTSTALPMFLSILRARRSLPDEPVWMTSTMTPDPIEIRGWMDGISDFVESTLRLIIPDNNYEVDNITGTEPLERDPAEKCEEAALMAYIGEILYASPPSASSEKAVMTARENGLAWTREAVDIAEECFIYSLRGMQDKKAKKVCRTCLETGLDNWAHMIRILVKDEKDKAGKEKVKPKGWFGGSKDGSKDDFEMVGRWESEDAVVNERIKRAQQLLSIGKPDPLEREKYNLTAFGGYMRGWFMP